MDLISKEYIQIIDVETTGFDVWRNSLIEYSSIIAKADTFELVAQKTGHARPYSKKYWSSDAELVHGITYNEAKKFPEPREAAIEWLKFLAPYKHKDNYPLLTVYHGNGNFDARWAEAFFAKCNLQFSWSKVASTKYTESTLKLAKNHLDIENFRLDTICEHLNIELEHHKAESDTLACYEIYKRLKPLEIK